MVHSSLGVKPSERTFIDGRRCRRYRRAMEQEPARRRRTEPSEVRRAQIIKAAKACFVRGGFGMTKVADIAQEAGISVGLVYRLFSGKEAIVEAIVTDEARDQVATLLAFFEEPGATAVSAMRGVVETLRSVLTDRHRNTLMIEIAGEMTRNEKVRRLALDVQHRTLAELRERLGKRSHLAMEPADLEVRLRLVGALASGAAVQLAASSEPLDETFFRLLERAASAIMEP